MAEKGLRSQMDWPSSYGCLYNPSLPDNILQQLRTDAASVAQCPNFWTPRVRQADGASCIRLSWSCGQGIGMLNVHCHRRRCWTTQEDARHLRQPSGTCMQPSCGTGCRRIAPAQSGGSRCAPMPPCDQYMVAIAPMEKVDRHSAIGPCNDHNLPVRWTVLACRCMRQARACPSTLTRMSTCSRRGSRWPTPCCPLFCT